MGITKTDFMRGMICPKMLWLDKHEPELRIIASETQMHLDRGNEFGDSAMGMFGPFEEMTVYLPDTHIPDIAAMLHRTEDHIKMGTPVICEAAFSYYYNYCAVDILRRTDAGFDIYEVKDSGSLKEEHIQDAGFQYYILKRCNINVGRIIIVTHRYDEINPFEINDVTDKAKGYENWIDSHIWELNRMQNQGEEIEYQVGDQCLHPYECWYYEYCHQNAEENAV